MTLADPLDTDIETYLTRHQNKDLLRFVTVGSVDDGKSTLIGRLLHDTKGAYEDQLAEARRASRDGKGLDLALLTDGLRAEREQGITIDVAYRYFTTPRRKFIIADTPGHVQYTRNMATGASTADVAIILIDARLGVLQQSKRHATIASMLGIPNLLVAINKMDLKEYSEEVFTAIRDEFLKVSAQLDFAEVTFFPISALEGDNVVEESPNTPWFEGGTLLHYLETVDVVRDATDRPLRLPVQTVLRPNQDYRGFAGQLASGTVRPGDPIMVLPSGRTSRVKAIDTYNGELEEAFAPMSITLRLEDEIDISRGDILVAPDAPPKAGQTFGAMVVWMHDTPLDPSRTYLIKHCTRYVRCRIHQVQWRLDMETLGRDEVEQLRLNDIGRVTLTTVRPLHFDPYTDDRHTGSFIVIDILSNNTVGAGMFLGAAQVNDSDVDSSDIGSLVPVDASERARRLGHRPALIGVHGAAADKAAVTIERRLFDRDLNTALIHATDDPDQTLDILQPCLSAGLITLCVGAQPTTLDAARDLLGAHLVFEVKAQRDTLETLQNLVDTVTAEASLS